MSIRDQILEDLIQLELFHTYTLDKQGNKVYTYESEGYDKEKIKSEGSIWIVYIYDCMSEYYRKNKEYFDNWVDDVLKENIIKV